MEVFFISFNYRDMLNQYLSNIFICKINLSNLYYNLKGEGSDNFYMQLSNDIIIISQFYNFFAELIKKIGGYPIMRLDEIKKISTIKEISSKDYTPKEAQSITIRDLTIINNMNNQVGEYAIKNYNLESINLTLKFSHYLQNRIWHLTRNN